MRDSDRSRLLKELRQAIDATDQLTGRQKRVAKRKLRRPIPQQQALDFIAAEAMVDGVFYASEEDQFEVLVDWDSFAAFLERILPLLLQLFGGFFGG